MLSRSNTVVVCILTLLCIFLLVLLRFILKQKNKKQLHKIFIILFGLILIWILPMILQIIFMDNLDLNIRYFYDIYYIGICFLPVAFFFMSIIFVNGKLEFKKRYLLLFIVPVLSIILLWTNDYHHLFYKEYSTSLTTQYGWYFYVHTFYTFSLFILSLIILLKYSVKNAGFFSKQALLIFVGALTPLVVNFLGSAQIIPVSIYATPMAFAFTIICFTFSIFKFDFFKITPIALQRIVDRMSDSYLVLNEDDVISDFNATFLTSFNQKEENLRNRSIFDLANSSGIKLLSEDKLKEALNEVKNSSKTVIFDKKFDKYNKYFHIEINTITSDGNFLGTLVLFKDTSQHMKDMETIKNNQDMLMEKERLASLGQLIGGIAHNLKTPIMSISGAAEGLSDLIKEYDSSIDDPEVTHQDHHDIAKDMNSWVEKIRDYTAYMSDVITAVKGQAVVMSEQDAYVFTVDELVKRVDILMKHELKNALISLKVTLDVDGNFKLKGNVNSLVQVINNMISNSIQAYDGKTNENIELNVSKEDSNIVISVKDYAGGLPKEVSDKLFKEMITTKGKNGTGLGLFMSYSNIRAHFNGNILVHSTPGVGTEFKIVLPV